MKLSRIYSSKLYITSNRKDKIHAAINNPQNAELVQQLSEYLDDDSKAKLDEIVEEKTEKKEEEVAEKEEGKLKFDKDIPDEKNVFSPSYSGSHGPIAPPSSGPDDFSPDMGDNPEGAPADEPAPEAPADEPVEESTAIYGKVTADTNLDAIKIDLASECNTIKGTLNAREDTAGVLRLAIDDDELWIYYKDEVNIGDIMVDVIEVLNGANYTYLSFSRLARSNNAIVFDVNLNTQEPIKTIQEIEEENK